MDGILFDSLFEAQAYITMKNSGLNISSVHKTFLLFDVFSYKDIDKKDHKVRDIKYTGDFEVISDKYDKPIIIETKNGIITGEYMLRRKLFLMKYSSQYYFVQLNSAKDIKNFVEKLKIEKYKEEKN